MERTIFIPNWSSKWNSKRLDKLPKQVEEADCLDPSGHGIVVVLEAVPQKYSLVLFQVPKEIPYQLDWSLQFEY